MKHWYVLLVFMASSGLAADQQSEQGVLTLSLKRAVQIAISPEGNEQLQITGESLNQAEARSNQARAALLPDISSYVSYKNQTSNLRAYGLGFNLQAIPGYSFSFPSLVGPFDVIDARVRGSQSVFDISSIRRLQSAHAGVSAAKSDLESTGEQVAAQVARAYLSAIRADADVETARANITLSQAVLNQAQNQKGAGTGTGIEITRARVLLANDQQRLLVAENARHRAYLQLLRAMNLSLDTKLDLTDKLGYVPVDAITLENARAQALEKRPDFKAQQQRENSARLSANATKMERVPSVSVLGDYGIISSYFDGGLPTRMVGVNVQIPVFDGGRMDARRAEAASQYRSELVRTKELHQQIELDVRLALDALHSAEEQVRIAREGLQLSESELAQAQRRYEAGVAFSLEVTDAQTRLERARDNQTEALYNYNLARIDLEQSMGHVRSSVQ
jgi:outer membrane protein